MVVRFRKGLKASERKRLKTQSFNIDKTYAIDVQWFVDNSERLSIEHIQENAILLEKNMFEEKYNLKCLWKKKI